MKGFQMASQRWAREPEAREHLGGMSHGAFYALARAGEIKPIKIGRSAFYDLHEIDAFMERKLAEQHGEGAAVR
jgi:hypothetical protein